MARAQVLGYVHSILAGALRAQKEYSRALQEDRMAIRLYPESPMPKNNLAWMIATKVFPERETLKHDALSLAEAAVATEPVPNFLDTLACTQALLGDFDAAVATEQRVVAQDASAEFYDRLRSLRAHHDCSGAPSSAVFSGEATID